MKVPDFDSDLDWFNSAPLSFHKELKGKIVVLDFWTYCCINCMHVLPELAALEEKYAHTPVAFIGVHSPKFINETSSENIRQAVMRYEITHPVVNDKQMSLWKALNVPAWPTIAIIDATGNVVTMISGEGRGQEIDSLIASLLQKTPPEQLDNTPLPIHLEQKKKSSTSPLRFPGKITVDGVNKHLIISDSNHHQIVIASLQGDILDTIGTGIPNHVDGSYQQAAFHRPQGVVCHYPHLFVADTENHAIRYIELENKITKTLIDADDGVYSPWDLLIDPKRQQLIIAMAGTHQLWVYDLAKKKVDILSGNGLEANYNSEQPLGASWAQPSGLTLADDVLFVADSESSTVRSLNLTTGSVQGIVGGDAHNPYNLFSFGDREGVGERAKLQHPLGVLWVPQMQSLVVADTYNHRLKKINPITKELTNWAGTGWVGLRDGPANQAQFAEPAGVALDPGGAHLLVADTNNHAIRKVSLATGEVTTLIPLIVNI